jgi:hypothetical protein
MAAWVRRRERSIPRHWGCDLRRGIDLLAVLCMTASTVALLRYRALTHPAGQNLSTVRYG